MTTELLIRFVDDAASCGDADARNMLMPKRSTPEAAAFDLVAANTSPIELKPMGRTLIPTGFAMALPPGFEAQVRPRSGLAIKHGLSVLNSPGTIDSDYRGEVKVILANLGAEPFTITRGMRIAQMVIGKLADVQTSIVESLPDSHRGTGGFGSTGV